MPRAVLRPRELQAIPLHLPGRGIRPFFLQQMNLFTLFFLNVFYKNIEAEVCEIMLLTKPYKILPFSKRQN